MIYHYVSETLGKHTLLCQTFLILIKKDKMDSLIFYSMKADWEQDQTLVGFVARCLVGLEKKPHCGGVMSKFRHVLGNCSTFIQHS